MNALLWLISAVCILHGKPTKAWSTPLTPAPIGSSVIGNWKLLSTTNANIKNRSARLEILPDLQQLNECKVKIQLYQKVLFSTSISQYVRGRTTNITLRTMNLVWNKRKQAEIAICGIGFSLASVDFFSPNPRGSIRKIEWGLLNHETLRVIYDDQVFIFGRTDCSESNILVPIELWFFMQILSGLYNHHVHLNL